MYFLWWIDFFVLLLRLFLCWNIIDFIFISVLLVQHPRSSIQYLPCAEVDNLLVESRSVRARTCWRVSQFKQQDKETQFNQWKSFNLSLLLGSLLEATIECNRRELYTQKNNACFKQYNKNELTNVSTGEQNRNAWHGRPLLKVVKMLCIHINFPIVAKTVCHFSHNRTKPFGVRMGKQSSRLYALSASTTDRGEVAGSGWYCSEPANKKFNLICLQYFTSRSVGSGKPSGGWL